MDQKLAIIATWLAENSKDIPLPGDVDPCDGYAVNAWLLRHHPKTWSDFRQQEIRSILYPDARPQP